MFILVQYLSRYVGDSIECLTSIPFYLRFWEQVSVLRAYSISHFLQLLTQHGHCHTSTPDGSPLPKCASSVYRWNMSVGPPPNSNRNGLQLTSDGLQPKSNGLQPNSHGRHLNANKSAQRLPSSVPRRRSTWNKDAFALSNAPINPECWEKS